MQYQSAQHHNALNGRVLLGPVSRSNLGLVEVGINRSQTVLFVRKLTPEPVALIWFYASTFPTVRF
jgi:hypothetical protein